MGTRRDAIHLFCVDTIRTFLERFRILSILIIGHSRSCSFLTFLASLTLALGSEQRQLRQACLDFDLSLAQELLLIAVIRWGLLLFFYIPLSVDDGLRLVGLLGNCVFRSSHIYNRYFI